MNNKFEQYEQLGRRLFKSYCQGKVGCKVTKYSTDPFAKWDISYTLFFEEVIGEIKVRQMDSTRFDTTFLQVDKLKALKELKGDTDALLHYIVIYDDKICIWDITSLDLTKYTIKEIELPKTTADGKNEYITKEIIELPIKNIINK